MKYVNNDRASVDALIDSFARTVDDVVTLAEFRERLLSGRRLRMKYGVDLTAPDLHIGHAVNLWLYRSLQELGHKMVFLLGDFTTTIGDPTGRSATRPVISRDVIDKNAEEFLRQAGMVLHMDPEVCEIRRNSEWGDRLTASDLLRLMSAVTLDRLMSRDMFKRRVAEGVEIYAHELVYPLLQGYDSVMLESDLTIIGTDQLFNEMMGRWFQEREDQAPQVIITTKITPGIDGGEKQSKSLGNYVGLQHSPRDKFGRLMRIPDRLVVEYACVYTDLRDDEIDAIAHQLESDPMEAKLDVAAAIVARYHGVGRAQEEREWFTRAFRRREIPPDVPTLAVGAQSIGVLEALRQFYGDEKSASALRRLVEQGAVRVDGHQVTDIDASIDIGDEGVVVKSGRRTWFRLEQ